MSLHKALCNSQFEGCHGTFSPEVKAEELADLRENCFRYEPSQLLSNALMFGVLPDLLDFSNAKGLDKSKIDYISSSYYLLTQIEIFFREDDKDKFIVFLNGNHDLIHDFPTVEVFALLCWNKAVACVSALLESPLGADIDVNHFQMSEASIPLEVAAFKLSLPLTQTLLVHGADANARGFHTSILDSALITLRYHKRVREWTTKHDTTNLILTLCDSDMKEAVAVTTLLAFHKKDVKSVLSLLVDGRNFIEMIILLFVARKKLLIPYDEWTFKDTPAAKYISQELKQVEFEHDEITKIKKKTDLNDACNVAESVWGACNFCLSHPKFKDVACDFVDSWHMASSKVKRDHSKGEGAMLMW